MLRFLSRAGVLRGFLGGSRLWTVVGSVALGVRVLRKLAGSEPESVFTKELRPGDSLLITHDREARAIRPAP